LNFENLHNHTSYLLQRKSSTRVVNWNYLKKLSIKCSVECYFILILKLKKKKVGRTIWVQLLHYFDYVRINFRTKRIINTPTSFWKECYTSLYFFKIVSILKHFIFIETFKTSFSFLKTYTEGIFFNSSHFHCLTRVEAQLRIWTD
jgi:hypothetical protein